MRGRIIVHIGTHKTGSTSIQHALAHGRQRLHRAGVLYPATDRGERPHDNKHASLGMVARSGDLRAAEDERRALLEEFEASGCHTLIVSAEGLSAPGKPVREFFVPLLAHHDVEVICCLRRQDLFVESLYNQFSREEFRRNAEPIEAFWRDGSTRERLDYHALLSRWREAFPRVVAMDFERAATGDGLLPSFLRHCGLEAIDLAEIEANRSPDIRVGMIVQQMNQAGLKYRTPSLVRASERRQVVERFGRMRHALGRHERALLLQEVAATNEKLAADFGIRFSERMPDNEGESPYQLEPAYVLAVLATVTRRQPDD